MLCTQTESVGQIPYMPILERSPEQAVTPSDWGCFTCCFRPLSLRCACMKGCLKKLPAASLLHQVTLAPCCTPEVHGQHRQCCCQAYSHQGAAGTAYCQTPCTLVEPGLPCMIVTPRVTSCIDGQLCIPNSHMGWSCCRLVQIIEKSAGHSCHS